MHVIESKINKDSDEYKKNYETLSGLVDDYQKELKRSYDERSEKSVNRLKESGKIPAKRKVEFVGEYKPNKIGMGGHKTGLKPSDRKLPKEQ